jgi:small ubiquitin-related modifier
MADYEGDAHRDGDEPPARPPNGDDHGNAEVKKEAGAKDAGAAAQVSLKVVNADGAEVFFKIKRTTLLKKLMEAYCKKQGVALGSVRFLYDGNLLKGEETPDGLEMEDQDVIDAMVEQTGGYLR